jgi:hypothetical protein
VSVLVGPRPDAAPATRTAPRGWLTWHRPAWLPAPASLLWPLLAAAVNAVAFVAVQPNVGDLEAALARQSAAASGVGLTYWFDWFGGGSSPGSYSVLTPLLSTLLGAPLVGALASVVTVPLARRAVSGTRHTATATWVAALTTGINLWAGRIPFALGCAVGVLALLALRERRGVLATGAAVVTMLCSPVPGAFLAFTVAAAILRDSSYRRLGLWLCGVSGLTFLGLVIFFGSPGSEGFAVASGCLTAGTALAMLLARPAPAVRVVLWCTAAAAVLLTCFPNGMGSNFTRLPWICLPVAVVATAAAPRRLVALAVLPALALAGNATVVDLVRSSAPSASAQYYRPLIRQLSHVPNLDNYRVEVVSNPIIHTAAYALLGHAALAGGYETQEQNQVNALLADRARLNATSYKVWLDNNAVGYVALDRLAVNTSPEYQLVRHRLPYLHRVSGDRKWLLYRVASPTPIVPPPLRVVSATQAQLRVRVPCACSTPLRLRYSKFLSAVTVRGNIVGTVRDDGTGWTVLITPRPGVYVLHGDLTRPLR